MSDVVCTWSGITALEERHTAYFVIVAALTLMVARYRCSLVGEQEIVGICQICGVVVLSSGVVILQLGP